MKKTIILLILIILLGALLRLYKLDKFPPSLFGDELDVGYQAYSILKTGKDYLGQSWPVSFHSISDWRTPLFLYADVPFIAIFGLNEWGVRLPAAIFGILTLPMFFLLIRKIFKDETLALIGTLFLSISMWHLQYSRSAFEVTLMLLLIITAVYLFLRGLEKWKYLILSSVMFALSSYSYNTAKLFIPVFIVFLVLIFRRELKKVPFKKLLIVIAVFIVISLPMLVDVFYGKAADRFSVLSIFTDPTTVGQIGFARQIDSGLSGTIVSDGFKPLPSSRFYHNKITFWGLTFLQNYYKAFSTDFLFVSGDINYRHSVQGVFGELYWPDAVLLILGIYYLCRQKDRQKFLLIFGWLLLAPVPSALTRDGGSHATRLILMLPPLLILISYGFYCFINIFKRKRQKYIVSFLFFIFYFYSYILYLHRYYVHYPLESEEWWHYGYKEMAGYIKENNGKYDYVVVSDRDQPPLIYLLFWLKIDPKILQNNKLQLTKISDAISADNIPGTNYFIGHVSKERINANGFIGTLKPNIFYLLPQSEIAKDFRYEPVPNSIELLQTIYYPSGRVSKYIFTGK